MGRRRNRHQDWCQPLSNNYEIPLLCTGYKRNSNMANFGFGRVSRDKMQIFPWISLATKWFSFRFCFAKGQCAFNPRGYSV